MTMNMNERSHLLSPSLDDTDLSASAAAKTFEVHTCGDGRHHQQPRQWTKNVFCFASGIVLTLLFMANNNNNNNNNNNSHNDQTKVAPAMSYRPAAAAAGNGENDRSSFLRLDLEGASRGIATSTTATGTAPALHYFGKASTEFVDTLPVLDGKENSFLDDLQTSTDPEEPITSGFYRQEVGPALHYTYTYHEMKIIVAGEFDISDSTGQSVHATPGDVFYFPKGSHITFSSPTFGLGFFCGQRGHGEA